MRIGRKNIEARMRVINSLYSLPKGYHYKLESHNPGDGRRYSVASVRDDLQGGDRYSIPSLGSLKGADIWALLGGMLEAVDLNIVICRLKKAGATK